MGHFKHFENGQTMVEVLVALTIGVVVVVALVAVVLVSLKNAQFGQNQSLATKYTQDALEKIRAVRDRDGQVVFTYGSGQVTSKFSDLWSVNMSTEPDCTSGKCYLYLCDSVLSINEISGSSCPSDLGNGFTRTVWFSDKALNTACSTSGPTPVGTTPTPTPQAFPCDYSKEKLVTVSVSWSDSSGIHNSNLQTILTPTFLPAPTP